MGPRKLTIGSDQTTSDAVREAVATLDAGGLVVIPTETVYGVAARADRPVGVHRLRTLKERPGEKAFTLHIADRTDADRFVNDLPARARRLTRKTWPGPLTLVCSVEAPQRTQSGAVLDELTRSLLYHEGAIGLRCPDHPATAAILRGVSGPVVATSANRAGAPPSVSGDEAFRDLGDQVDLVLDSGRTTYARPSSIVRVTEQGLEVIREGVYDQATVDRLSVLRILFVCTGNTCRSPMAAALAKRNLADRLRCDVEELPARGILVSSAGTSGGCGRASDLAVQVMARRGLDLSGHVSQSLTPDMIGHADHVLAMTRNHYRAAVEMVPSAAERIMTLLPDEDVQDPVGGGEEEYESCARLIEQGVADRLAEISL